MRKRVYLILVVALFITAIGKAQTGQATLQFKEGDEAPDFEGVDQRGDTLALQSLLKEGQVLLIFYRGTWCPYCISHLKELQEMLLKIQRQDANVVVVTPEQPQYVQQTIKKTDAEFSIVSDKDYEIMKAYGVAFKRSAMASEMLPVPATFIIKPDGHMSYIHFDPDYTQRSDLYEVVRELKKD